MLPVFVLYARALRPTRASILRHASAAIVESRRQHSDAHRPITSSRKRVSAQYSKSTPRESRPSNASQTQLDTKHVREATQVHAQGDRIRARSDPSTRRAVRSTPHLTSVRSGLSASQSNASTPQRDPSAPRSNQRGPSREAHVNVSRRSGHPPSHGSPWASCHRPVAGDFPAFGARRRFTNRRLFWSGTRGSNSRPRAWEFSAWKPFRHQRC